MPWRLAIVGFMATVLIACSPTAPARGAETREALVSAYLSALAARNAELLLGLTDPAVEARANVEALVAAHGGTDLSDPAVTWRDEFGGIFVVATVTGTAPGNEAITLTIPISRKADRFFLALGQVTPTGSESGAESPSP